MKTKLEREGSQLYDKIVQLKMQAPDGKMRLTDEWERRGVNKGQEYAVLTDIIAQGWSGMTTKQYKGLKTESI